MQQKKTTLLQQVVANNKSKCRLVYQKASNGLIIIVQWQNNKLHYFLFVNKFSSMGYIYIYEAHYDFSMGEYLIFSGVHIAIKQKITQVLPNTALHFHGLVSVTLQFVNSKGTKVRRMFAPNTWVSKGKYVMSISQVVRKIPPGSQCRVPLWFSSTLILS